MSVKTVTYAPTIAGDTKRGPSNVLFGSFPPPDGISGKEVLEFEDDFLISGDFLSTASAASGTTSMGQWGFFSDSKGVLDADPALEGGVIALSSGANSGVNTTLQGLAGAFGIIAPTTYASRRKLAFECRVAVGSITTGKRDCFIGLMDAGTPATNVPISGANALSTTPGLIGFHFRDTSNPTDVGFCYNVAGGTVQYPTGLQTLALTVAGAALAAYTAGTGFIKLGFLFDPDAFTQQIVTASTGQTAGNLARPILKVFVNGLPAPAFLTTTNVNASTFPSAFMTPVISRQSQSATSPGDFYVDFVKVKALANS